MARKKVVEDDRIVEVLEKILVFQLHALGLPQDKIGKTVGKQKAWVNELLKGIAKGGKIDGRKAKTKKTNRRSHN